MLTTYLIVGAIVLHFFTVAAMVGFSLVFARLMRRTFPRTIYLKDFEWWEAMLMLFAVSFLMFAMHVELQQ